MKAVATLLVSLALSVGLLAQTTSGTTTTTTPGTTTFDPLSSSKMKDQSVRAAPMLDRALTMRWWEGIGAHLLAIIWNVLGSPPQTSMIYLPLQS